MNNDEQDIKERKINTIMVYKLDRFTRSIKDFEKIYTLLDEYHCDLLVFHKK